MPPSDMGAFFMSNVEIKKSGRAKTIGVVLTPEADARLSESAKKAGRSRQLEAMLRLYDHMKKFPEINGDYYEITTL